MHFSVILEGSCEEYSSSTEDSKSEVERFLHSVKVSPKLLSSLDAKKPVTLKDGLTYEDAIKICDRLAEFGLDCFIDPPTKPEEDEKPPQAKSSDNVHTLPKNKAASTAQIAAQSKNSPPPPKAPSNVTPLRKSASKSKQSSTNQSHVSAEVATKQVKSLFRIPKEGVQEFIVSQADKVAALRRTLGLLTLALGYPTLLVGLAISFSIVVYNFFTLASSLSILLALISSGILSVIAAVTLCVLSAPLWARRASPIERIQLEEKEEARFLALINLCCRIFKLNPPSAINLALSPIPDYETPVRCEIANPGTQLLKRGEKIEQPYSLSISALYLRFFSAREFCGYVVATCARFDRPEFRHNAVVEQWASNLLFEFSRNRSASSQAILDIVHNSPSLSTFLAPLAKAFATVEIIPNLYCKFATQVLKKRLKAQTHFTQSVRSFVEGQSGPHHASRTFNEADTFYHSALEEMLNNNTTGEYIDDIVEYARLLEKESSMESSEERQAVNQLSATSSILIKDFPIRNLLSKREEYCKTLTAEVFFQHGIKIKKEHLIPLKSFRANVEKQHKLKALAAEYFSHWYSPQQLWRLPPLDHLRSSDSDKLMRQLDHNIERIRFASPDRNNNVESHLKAVQQIAELQAASKLKQSGVDLTTKTTHIAGNNAEGHLKKLLLDFKELTTELGQQNAIMGERLALGLLLDVQRQAAGKRLHQSLQTLGECGNKATQLRTYLIEYELMLNNPPPKQSQHYQLQVRELSNKVSESSKFISRKLKQCAFDMCDPRYPTLGALADNKLALVSASKPDYRTLEKGQAIIQALEQGFEQLSCMAAAYASRMEKLCGVQSIRKAEIT